MERIAVLGASRGLGAQICQAIPPGELLAVARSLDRLEKLRHSLSPDQQLRLISADFTQPSDQDRVLKELTQFQPQRLFYCAGGGPFGLYQDKKWSDHQWAWEVTFVFAARVAHWGLRQATAPQIIFCGSAVAESSGDPQASSYAAAKHALKGLLESLWLEQSKVDLRLVSPGYMDTDLLPNGCLARREGLVWDPNLVAREIVSWAQLANAQRHKVYSLRP